MDPYYNQHKANIFYEEINDLKRRNLITQNQFDQMNFAYTQLQEQRRYTAAIQHSSYIQANQNIQNKENENKSNSVTHIQSYPAVVNQSVKKVEKKIKSADEIRESNITWSLILGVIMLLTAGLILSTSNWSYMNDMLKVISIASVSILFLTLSWFTEKILKITKTSFAFLILGSSFIPIIFVGIGFFELFGEWLSFYGDGKYVLGLLGSITSFYVYSVNARKHQSKLFSWLSLFTLSSSVAFGLATLKLNIDLFYLGIILYNALILFGYYKYKTSDKLQWIIKEVPLFSQINLILSSIFVLFFFNHYLFYSFNLILISVLYISMMYINQSKNYHFVFTAFVTYGFYQLANHTSLFYIKEIIIASIGLIFIGLQYVQKNDDSLKKIYQWTCAIISFLAFIYISIHSLVLNSDSNPIIVFISYIALCLNYVYLSNITKQNLFSYLANIFAVLSIHQLYKSIPALSDYFEIFSFILISGLLYLVYFKKQAITWLVQLKDASLVVNGIAYIAIIVYASSHEKWLTAFILSILVSTIFYISSIKEKSVFTKINLWGAPILLIFGSLSLFEMIKNTEYELILHLSITSVCMIVISKILTKWNITNTSTFYIPQVLYGMILLSIPSVSIDNESLVIPLIMLLSLFMAYSFTRKIRINGTWIIFSILSSLFYFSLLLPLADLFDHVLVTQLYLLAYPIVFLVVMKYVKEKISPYFYWTSLAFSIISNIAAFIIATLNVEEIPSWVMVIPTLIYAYHAWKGNSEVKVKTNLYLSLITVPLLLLLIFDDYFPAFDKHSYVVMFAGLCIVGLWLISNREWKRRVDWFIIPYLAISQLLVFILFDKQFILGNILLAISVLINVFLVHYRKWVYALVVPLFEMTLLLLLLINVYSLSNLTIALSLSIIILVLQLISNKINRSINLNKYLDWYYIFSIVMIFIFELFMYEQSLLFKVMPAMLLTLILFSTIKRVSSNVISNVFKTLTVASLFIIYYKIVYEFYDEIWSHITLELLILPFIIAIIFLKKKVWANEKVMTTIEWIVLSIIAILIVFDGIISSTIVDTIIMGIIGLVAVILGMNTRIKSYFFIGSGMILITLYTQTRPLWKSMPWWIYLLVAGVILITFASIHEWQKQNNQSVKDKWRKIKEKFNNWN